MAVQYRTSINQHKLAARHSPGSGTTLQTPFSPVSFGKSFTKIRSAIPENGCLTFFLRMEKTKTNKQKQKNKKTSVKHICYRLIDGCVNETQTDESRKRGVHTFAKVIFGSRGIGASSHHEILKYIDIM